MSNTSDLINLFNKVASPTTIDLLAQELTAYDDDEMYVPPTDEQSESDNESDCIDEEIDQKELYDLMHY